MTTPLEERIDVSAVRAEDQAYLRAYFRATLEGRSFRSCTVRRPDPDGGSVLFEIVFDDGSKSRTLDVPGDVAFGDDRRDQVVYDDDTGARRTVLGFVPDGVLKKLVDQAFSQAKAG
jgi:hypothetical protein